MSHEARKFSIKRVMFLVLVGILIALPTIYGLNLFDTKDYGLASTRTLMSERASKPTEKESELANKPTDDEEADPASTQTEESESVSAQTGKSKIASAQYDFNELTRLADKYSTDKGTNGHYFSEVYDRFFSPIKQDTHKICEIGIETGGSLKMFRDYFPNAVYYGMDIRDLSVFNSNVTKTFVADQADRKQLKAFINTYGRDFDIILDDGGHSMQQQQTSFGYLFKYLRPGGYYVIEDVHTSIPEYYSSYGVDATEENTTLTMLNKFIRSGTIKSKYMTSKEEAYLTGNIESCNLFSRNQGRSITCILKKSKNTSDQEGAANSPPSRKSSG